MGEHEDLLNLYPESKSWRVWVDDLITKSYNTRRHYVKNFLDFLERWDTDPEALFRVKLDNLTSPDPRDRRIVEGWVKVSMSEITNSGKSASAARMVSKAVNSFFDAQNLEFRLRPREKPATYYNGQRVITKEQILTLYDRVGEEHRLRNRAIILTLKDSGLRVSDLCSLNVGDYTGAVVRQNAVGEPFKTFTIETIKTGYPAHVHLGPESIETLDLYLGELEGKGRLEAGAPLIQNRDGKRHTPAAMASLVWKLCKKLAESDKISAHSLRKFFQTQMEAAGVPKNWIGKFQGKKVGDSSGPYSRPEETGLLTEAYLNAYDNLRIFEVAEVKELKRQIAELKAGKNSEVSSLRAEVRELKDLFKTVIQNPELIEEIKKKIGESH